MNCDFKRRRYDADQESVEMLSVLYGIADDCLLRLHDGLVRDHHWIRGRALPSSTRGPSQSPWMLVEAMERSEAMVLVSGLFYVGVGNVA